MFKNIKKIIYQMFGKSHEEPFLIEEIDRNVIMVYYILILWLHFGLLVCVIPAMVAYYINTYLKKFIKWIRSESHRKEEQGSPLLYSV